MSREATLSDYNDYATVARATVVLPRPLTGTEVMTAIKAVIEHKEGIYKPEYVQTEHYIDGEAFLAGQMSGYPYEHLLVTPKGSAEGFIFPDEHYTELTVKSHSWGGTIYMVGYEADSVINAVRTFAEALPQQVSSN